MTDTARAGRTERYWSKQSPEGPWDAVVIGSGMGGMTCAAFLARLGRRVLVLEQHYVPGGFTHTFTRRRYTWDVGVHAVGEVTEHSLPGRLLAHLTDGRLRWASLGPVYDAFHFPDGFRLDFPDHPRRYRENLVAAFPSEAPAIDAYLRRASEVAGAMKGYYLARAAPGWLAPAADLFMARRAQGFLEEKTCDVVAGLTQDPRLRAVFTAQWGYYGSPPSRSSFAIQALVVKHFLYGGYYPVGGSKEIARSLLRTVANAGGWTRVQADVKEILVENGRAAGVRLTSGEEIRARRVISAAGILATVRRLLPEEFRAAAWAREVDTLRPASAHVCLYLGLKGDIRGAGASAANQWFYHTWDPEQEAWDVGGQALSRGAPVLYCSFPSLKDPEYDPGPENRHTAEIVTFVPWETFRPWQGTGWRKRGDEYQTLKTAMQEIMLEQFLSRYPALRPMVDYAEVSTPLSTDLFCRPISGSIYGLEPTPDRFRNRWLRPRSPIPDLLFAGSEVTSVGVVGAMMGGALAALAAEPLPAFRLIRSLG